jgi:hypothetical protein
MQAFQVDLGLYRGADSDGSLHSYEGMLGV